MIVTNDFLVININKVRLTRHDFAQLARYNGKNTLLPLGNYNRTCFY